MFDWIFSGVLPEVAERWDYAVITLVVRFIGVFVVMGVMQIALQASARVVRTVEKRQAPPIPANSVPIVESSPAAAEIDQAGLGDATVAAIGLALALESRQPSAAAPTGGPSAWSSAWRMRQSPRSPAR
jgi:hypothetical protein